MEVELGSTLRVLGEDSKSREVVCTRGEVINPHLLKVWTNQDSEVFTQFLRRRFAAFGGGLARNALKVKPVWVALVFSKRRSVREQFRICHGKMNYGRLMKGM